MQIALTPEQTRVKRVMERVRADGSDKNHYAEQLLNLGIKLRPKQLAPPGDWLIWIIQAGRGFGKTLAGAFETLRQSERWPHLAIVAATYGDGRDYCVEGETGLKTLCRDLDWNRSMGEMTFPSGCKGKVFSAEEPDRLRGPNNYFAWCDEFGSWKYQKAAWDMLMFTMRKGAAQTVITNTPKPSPLYKELKKRPTAIVVYGSTRENMENLSPAYIENVIKPYEGTTLGRQEIDAEDIEDVDGALWKRANIDELRVSVIPDLRKIVVAVDPAATSNAESNDTGIVVCGLGIDGHGYVLDDMTIKASPAGWAKQAIAAYHKFEADHITYETNQGGDMVLHTLKSVIEKGDPIPPMHPVHAARGKRTRAEPVSGLYEQGKVHHLGSLPMLEDQLCTWMPGDDSPDRLDALVWALTDLMVGKSPVRTETW